MKASSALVIVSLPLALAACKRTSTQPLEATTKTAAAVTSNDGGTAGPSLPTFAVLATRSVLLQQNAAVSGGDVGAGGLTTTGTLYAGETLVIQSNATTSANKSAYGKWLEIDNNGTAGQIFTDHLTAQNNAVHGPQSAFVLPPAVPSIAAVAAGGTSVTVSNNQTKTLAPGAYATISVSNNAVLHLSGGLYQVGSFVVAGSNAKIDVAAATDLRIAGTLSFSQNVTVGPAAGSGLTAKALLIEVSGANDGGSAIKGTPSAAAFQNAQIQALIVAPNGTIVVAQNAKVIGAVAANDVEVQQNALVTWQDGFPAGTCITSCDDGNSCTADACVAGACVHTPVADGTTCSDGNACTQADSCKSGTCVGSNPVTCAASDACHVAGTCSPATGQCSNPVAADGTACSDGNACTRSDSCKSGTCVGINPVSCSALDQCHVAGTCDPTSGACSNPIATLGTSCNDGNACNGINDTCNSVGGCVGNGTVVIDDGNPCTADSCNPTTGVVHTPLPAGSSCSDGNACNGTETCNATGACMAGVPPVLDDGNPCTVDSCSPLQGVTHTAAAAGVSCSDGNVCNGAETCNGTGVCKAGTPPVIDDGNPCTADACDSLAGVTHTPVATGSSCSDGNACNGVELCNASGTCTPGVPPVVDDGNPCTADACDPRAGVTHTPVAAGTSCSDGNACNGAETCNGAAVCAAGVPPVVDDGNPCTADSCDPSQGVLHAALQAGTSCSDSNACNGSESCSATGVCLAGTPPTVSDGNPCTIDTCDPSQGVTHVAVAAGTSCSDGNACNGAEVCSSSATCVASTPPVLDDGNPCTADSCDPGLGVLHTPVAVGTACNDGNACDGLNDTCNAAGVCVGNGGVVLDDGNPCTSDTCDPVRGVLHTPTSFGSSCSDGNACNGSETCDGLGHCSQGVAPAVDDGNACTVDACDPTAGVTHTPSASGTSCSDGNVCNGSEVCDGTGTCRAGTPLVVDDGNACTADSCDPVRGVSHTPQAAGFSCSDNNACNGLETCDGTGGCSPGTAPTLDDHNPCTADSCNPTQGVLHSALQVGTSCSDGNACNGEETCSATGACLPGAAPTLDDGNPCTNDVCDAVKGIGHPPVAQGTSCSDGNACNGQETCNGSGACSPGQPPELSDNNPCTTDSCDPVQGVVHAAVAPGTSCSNGNVCDGDEICTAKGACVAGPRPAVDDGNPCTSDGCDPLSGVFHAPVAAGASCPGGNACTGLKACDGTGVCAAGPAPVIDDGNPCTADSCDPVKGPIHLPVAFGTSCSDGNVCNGAEVCSLGGTCQSGTPLAVDDGNPCTADICDPSSGVSHQPLSSGSSCSDANQCNGLETCNGLGNCMAGQPVAVDDGNPCTKDTCDPPTGKVSHTDVVAGTSCDDGNACNGVETCDAKGVCVAGTPPDLMDGQPCTSDTCDPSFGVIHTPTPGAICGDGSGQSLCNAAGACVSTAAEIASVLCDDGNACTIDTCDAPGGPTHTPAPQGTHCGGFSPYFATCDGSGVCLDLTGQPLSDGNPCTNDFIAGGGGDLPATVHSPVVAGSSCSDGNACNGLELCDAYGNCQAGTPPHVAGQVGCTVQWCDPLLGVQTTPLPNQSSCSDGLFCDGVELCNYGTCVATNAPIVDDGNPCTIDSCDEINGVLHVPTPAGSSCDDGNLCNGSETCDGSGACQPGTPLALDDGNPCTDDACSYSAGVTHTPSAAGTSCTDANPCNGAETCNGSGSCQANAPPSFDDGNPCTVDTCDPVAGVLHTPLSAGSSCSDGNPCNGLETCDIGANCVATSSPVIDDGNPCTRDSCSAAGVAHDPMPAGTQCADLNPCNGIEVCSAVGTCLAASAPNFDDGDPCTIDECSPATGVTHRPVALASCTPSTPAWQALAVGRPSPRDGAGMALDAAGQNLFVFGGENAGVSLGDTWILDRVGRGWRTVLAGPGPRTSPVLVFDSQRLRYVLFGGVRRDTSGDVYLADTWEYDVAGDQWLSMKPAGGPPARAYAAASFDEDRQAVVIFGGAATGAAELGDTWEWNGSTWTQRDASVSPPARHGATMAFDPDRSRMVLFGGSVAQPSGPAQPLADCWELNTTARLWTACLSALTPTARTGHSLTYDRDRHRMVLLGGTGSPAQAMGDTWEYDGAAGVWSENALVRMPTGRAGHAAFFDPGSRHVLAFGGLLYSESGITTPSFDDLLDYDPTAGWTSSLAGVGPAITQQGLAFDSARGVFVIRGLENRPFVWELDRPHMRWAPKEGGAWDSTFGAPTPGPMNLGALFFDALRGRTFALSVGRYPDIFSPGSGQAPRMWEWDGTSWTERISMANGSAVRALGFAWDASRRRLIAVGDREPFTYQTAAYEIDVDGGSWLRISPPPSDTTSYRVNPMLAWDSDRGVTVLYGGGSDNSTWEWNGTTWSPSSSVVSPTASAGVAATFDATLHRIVTFGGRASAETWEYDAAGWHQRFPVHSPAARSNASMAYDSARGRTVLFGGQGSSGAPLWDFWEWDGSDWTRTRSGASPLARSGASGGWSGSGTFGALFGGVSGTGQRVYLQDTWVFRDGEWAIATPPSPNVGPSSQTAQSTSARQYVPSARAGHVFGVGFQDGSARPGTGLLVGGESDSGLLGDVWTWDDASFAWTEQMWRVSPRAEHAIAVWPGAGYLIFGGRDASGAALNDARQWNVAEGSWGAYLPVPASLPPARMSHSMILDESRNIIVLFGGRGGDGHALYDTWEFDPTAATWTETTAATHPNARFGHRLAYDSLRQKVVLTGGVGDSATDLYGDTWEYDGSTKAWSVRSLGQLFSPRAGHFSFFDTARGEPVLFGGLAYAQGGAATATLGDTWSFARAGASDVGQPKYPIGSPCSSPNGCASGFCTDGVCCESACGGQCASCNTGGAPGKCATVRGQPGGGRAACPAGGLCGPLCDGIDPNACHMYAPGAACGSPSCAGSVAINVGTCDSNGQCTQPTHSCVPNGCSASTPACSSSCATTQDCAAGFFCAQVSWTGPGAGINTLCEAYASFIGYGVKTIPASPVPAGTAVTVFAQANSTTPLPTGINVTGDLRYTFSYGFSNAPLVTACTGATDRCPITLTDPGTYVVRVEVKDSQSPQPFDDAKQITVVVGAP